MTKINIDRLDKKDLLSIIKDVQWALDGKWDRASDLHYDTGIPMDMCDDVIQTINLFMSIDTDAQ